MDKFKNNLESPSYNLGKYIDVSRLLIDAKNASLEFCVFPHNATSPMSDASLARLLYKHIPEFAEIDRMERQPSRSIPEKISALPKPSELSRFILHDMEIGREYSRWLAPHLSSQTKAFFAQGSKNSLNPVIDRLADMGGFVRSDVLTREAAAEGTSPERIRSHAALAALAAKNMGMGD